MKNYTLWLGEICHNITDFFVMTTVILISFNYPIFNNQYFLLEFIFIM